MVIQNKSVEDARFKARLVAYVFGQTTRCDFNVIFSNVVKFISIRVLLSLVVQFNLLLKQIDVKSVFLYGDLDDKIYMKQLKEFIKKSNENLICLLEKSLYGLK